MFILRGLWPMVHDPVTSILDRTQVETSPRDSEGRGDTIVELWPLDHIFGFSRCHIEAKRLLLWLSHTFIYLILLGH